MKKTLLKRVLCAGVAAAMMLSLGGCGKKNTPEVASKDNLYSAKEFELKDIQNVMTMTASSDKIFIVSTKDIKVKNENYTPAEGDVTDSGAAARVMYGSVSVAETVTAAVQTEPAADTGDADEVSDDTADTAEEAPAEEAASDDLAAEEVPVPAEVPAEEYIYYYQTILSVYDYEGNELANKVIFDSQERGQNYSYNVNRMFMSEDKVGILVNEYSWNMETNESTESFFIDKFSTDLSSSERVSLDGVKDQYDENEYFYVNSYVEDDSGNSYMYAGESIAVSDPNGKFLFKLKLEKNNSQDSGSNISNVIKGKNGKVYALINSYSIVDDNYTSTTTAKTIDLEKQDFGTEEYNITAPINSYGNMSIDYGDFDLAYDGETALYGYKIETDEKTVLIDWIKSGIDTTAPESIFVAPDGRIIYSSHKYELNGNGGYSYSDGSLVINVLTKLDPSEIPDKQLISVYTMYLPWDVKSKISEFNRNSDKYQIEVTSYLDNNWNDYDNCLTRLNNDLVAGKIPDILIVDSSLPFNSYVSKGLIADLNPIIEKDETFKREDYLENVLEALTVDGKLCRIATSFNIRTFAAKKSIVGDKDSWTMDDFIAVAEANPDAEMQLETTSKGFIQTMVVYNIDQYVNYETGQCSFNSDSFKKILEYAKTLPEEIDYDSLYQDDTYWMKRDTAFRENRAILRDEYIYDLRAFKQDEEGYFGEPVTFIGIPSDSGENGSMLQLDSSLAIMAKAKNPDGAWEFIKTLLTDEMQEKAGGFPVKLSAYDKLMESAKERPYWEDENGEKQYYDYEVWIGNEGVKVTPNTDADNERMMNFIKSVKGVYSYDQDLFKIIDEEVQAFFSGQKSVDEVTELIQNRASTYVSENM